MPKQKTALVSTLSPKMAGGVQTHQRFICQLLEEQNIKPIIAHYEPYPFNKQLSVRAHQLLFKKNNSQSYMDNNQLHHAIGTYLPELEFPYHWLTKPWKQFIDHADYHLAISGNVLPALPFYQAKIPYMTFNSTTYWEDRKNRIHAFSKKRQLFNTLCIKKPSQLLEKKIIQKGNIMMLSEYTKKEFTPLGLPKDNSCDIIPIAVNTKLFHRKLDNIKPWRIGFVGRLADPRKNIPLLIKAINQLKNKHPQIECILASGDLDQESLQLIQHHHLQTQIKVLPYLTSAQLTTLYQSLDCFVIPSFQEGFCIAGLEALACGCPIISTRCGGPEEYVINEVTGYLIENDPSELSQTIQRICANRKHRDMMSNNALALVDTRYTIDAIRDKFWTHFKRVFQSQAF